MRVCRRLVSRLCDDLESSDDSRVSRVIPGSLSIVQIGDWKRTRLETRLEVLRGRNATRTSVHAVRFHTGAPGHIGAVRGARQLALRPRLHRRRLSLGQRDVPEGARRIARPLHRARRRRPQVRRRLWHRAGPRLRPGLRRHAPTHGRPHRRADGTHQPPRRSPHPPLLTPQRLTRSRRDVSFQRQLVISRSSHQIGQLNTPVVRRDDEGARVVERVGVGLRGEVPSRYVSMYSTGPGPWSRDIDRGTRIILVATGMARRHTRRRKTLSCL